MIPSSYYQLFYILVVTLLSFVTLSHYGSFRKDRLSLARVKSIDISILIAIFFVFFIGLRDPYGIEFGDSQKYTRAYMSSFGDPFAWDWEEKNYLYDNIFLLFSSKKNPIEYFYLFISFVYFFGIWFCCKKLFPKDSASSFVVYLIGFSTYSYSVNGIKAGAAASLFLIAIALRERKKYILTGVFLFFSLGFHHSMLMPIIVFIFCSLIKNSKFYMGFWFVCFIISVLHIKYFQNLFLSFGGDIDDKIIGYLGEDLSTYKFSTLKSGFRFDFVLYSFIPILIGWLAIFKKGIQSDQYRFVLNLYTFINAIWMLCMYASFTNRIAYLSWLIYPIVLIYPFIKEKWGENQNKIYKWVAYGHLTFTLFMFFVYYT